MDDIHLSGPLPILHYRPKKATIHQTADMKWCIGITYEVEVEKPEESIVPVVTGIDRNIGNVATADAVFEVPERMKEKMEKQERNIRHWRRVMSRCQGPNYKECKPRSKRYEVARRIIAYHQRKLANLCKNIVRKTARVLVDTGITHLVDEKLDIINMTGSASGTKEKPGKKVAQKKGFNKSTLRQGWGMLFVILSYMLVGGIIKVDPAYTSQTCSWCLHVDKNSRLGRLFWYVSCGFIHHADCNAGCNIENSGRRILGLARKTITSLV